MLKTFKHLIFLLVPLAMWSQKDTVNTPIEIIHADKMILDQKYPHLKLLTGNVRIKHKDVILTSEKVLLDLEENFAEAIGNVVLSQADSLKLSADVVRYDGTLDFALALGQVFLTDPTMQLSTDTLYYNKKQNLAFYDTGGKIVDTVNTIESQVGKYYTKQNRYEFIGRVKIVNPDYTIFSSHLDYRTDVQTSTFYGPTEIHSRGDLIYAEKGFYDSQNKFGWFKNNTYVEDKKGRWMAADSIHFSQQDSVYSATGNVRIKDTINKVVALAGLATQWSKKDSIHLSVDPVVINFDKKDTMYFSARDIYIKKKDTARIVYAYPEVRFINGNISGKADSLFRDERKFLIELYRNPVLWSEDSQITGDTIFIKNTKGNRIDSLLIWEHVFIIQKDSAGYNQIKGKKLTGKFVKGKLRKIDITGNTKTLYYIRDENGKLVGIDKSVCSEINIELNEEGKAEKIYLREEPQGTTYPPEKLPENQRKLEGFHWRGEERIKSPDELLKGRNPNPAKPERKKILPPDKQENFHSGIPVRILKGL